MSTASDDSGEMDTERQGPEAAVPYRTYDNSVRVRAVGVFHRGASPEVFKNTAQLTAQTRASLNDETGSGKELVLADGVRTGLWTLMRPMDEKVMPSWYGGQVLEYRLDLVGAKSGIELHGNWTAKLSASGLMAELVAAHLVYNSMNGTKFQVVFEPDAARFGAKNLKGVPIAASTADAATVFKMLEALKASAYGSLKYFLLQDQSPRLQVGAGTWMVEWKEITLECKLAVGLIGLEQSEFEDALGSGIPLGVLRAILGDVSLVQTYGVKGYQKTKRLLIACQVSEARDVYERLDAATWEAVGGHGINVEGALVSVVRPSALEQVYTGLHGFEVSDSGGGAGTKVALSELKDQLREVETAAAAERERAAEEMRVAAERQIAMQGEVHRIAGVARTLQGQLASAASKASAAEAMAAQRHQEAQEAQAKVSDQAANMLELNKKMAWFMAECAAGRNPMTGQHGGAALTEGEPTFFVPPPGTAVAAGGGGTSYDPFEEAGTPSEKRAPLTPTKPLNAGAASFQPSPGRSGRKAKGQTKKRAEHVKLAAVGAGGGLEAEALGRSGGETRRAPRGSGHSAGIRRRASAALCLLGVAFTSPALPIGPDSGRWCSARRRDAGRALPANTPGRGGVSRVTGAEGRNRTAWVPVSYCCGAELQCELECEFDEWGCELDDRGGDVSGTFCFGTRDVKRGPRGGDAWRRYRHASVALRSFLRVWGGRAWLGHGERGGVGRGGVVELEWRRGGGARRRSTDGAVDRGRGCTATVACCGPGLCLGFHCSLWRCGAAFGTSNGEQMEAAGGGGTCGRGRCGGAAEYAGGGVAGVVHSWVDVRFGGWHDGIRCLGLDGVVGSGSAGRGRRADGLATLLGECRERSGQCEEKEPWALLDQCPRFRRWVGANCSEGAAVGAGCGCLAGHRRGGRDASDDPAAGGGLLEARSRDGGGTRHAAGGVAHAVFDARACAVAERRRGGWPTADEREGGGSTDGRAVARTCVEGGGQQVLRAEAVGGGGGCDRRAPREGDVGERGGDDGGIRAADARACVALRRIARRCARHHSDGREGARPTSGVQSGGGAGQGEKDVGGRGLLGAGGAAFQNGVGHGACLSRGAGRGEYDAELQTGLVGAAGGVGESASAGVGSAERRRVGVRAVGDQLLAGGCVHGGVGGVAHAQPGALRLGAAAVGKLAVRLAGCGGRRGLARCVAPPETRLVGGRAATGLRGAGCDGCCGRA